MDAIIGCTMASLTSSLSISTMKQEPRGNHCYLATWQANPLLLKTEILLSQSGCSSYIVHIMYCVNSPRFKAARVRELDLYATGWFF